MRLMHFVVAMLSIMLLWTGNPSSALAQVQPSHGWSQLHLSYADSLSVQGGFPQADLMSAIGQQEEPTIVPVTSTWALKGLPEPYITTTRMPELGIAKISRPVNLRNAPNVGGDSFITTLLPDMFLEVTDSDIENDGYEWIRGKVVFAEGIATENGPQGYIAVEAGGTRFVDMVSDTKELPTALADMYTVTESLPIPNATTSVDLAGMCQ